MKVVLFCGGQGLRIRDAEDVPKPMVHIGYRPILWHSVRADINYNRKCAKGGLPPLYIWLEKRVEAKPPPIDCCYR